jgi:MHS family alpha-ketoglutarate permease-like MFS transporter
LKAKIAQEAFVRPSEFITVRRRIVSVFGGSIGNLIEWYDFYIYNFFALYFAKAFLPNSDPTVQLLNTFAIYALGFLIRPVDGWLLGVYADRSGRRGALTLSVTLMCLGSLMIGLAPTYVSIGLGAPVLLLVARLIQGISLGGEYGTSATYLSEIATSRYRGFYSSFQYVTLIGGQVFGSVTLLIMQQLFAPAQLEAWGWRVPFLIGAACAAFGFYLRRNLQETMEVKRASAEARSKPLADLLRHPRQVLLVFGLTMGGTTAFLHLHHLYADLPGQHRQAHARPGDTDFLHHARDLRGDPASVWSHFRLCGTAAGAHVVRGAGHALHRSDPDHAGRHA